MSGEVFEYFLPFTGVKWVCGVMWWHCVPLFKVFSKGFVDCFRSAFDHGVRFSYCSEEERFVMFASAHATQYGFQYLSSFAKFSQHFSSCRVMVDG